MAKKGGLAKGKGLADLLGDMNETYSKELGLDLNRVEEISLEDISPNPFQPRKNFDEQSLEELAASIKEYGLIQPIILLKKHENSYILVAGERRFRACKILQMPTIKAVIAKIDENKLRELALIENIQRENLNPIELANSYKDLIEEHNITQEDLAGLIHKSRSQITNTLRLLNLDEKTQELIAQGKISQGHAKVIVGLEKKDEKMVVDTILGQKLNVRETEKIVQKMKNKSHTLVDENFNQEFDKFKKHLDKLNIKYKVQDTQITLSLNDIEKIREINKLFS
ncbi:chromosome partitioning protein ParB [Campylobacter sp. MIT 99-7217]|uniref:ParB/RepB/Spo0J family partition protein n=1 Tax=Campylobacter sp. MIT 99-7217 TaxID=535091 RepID=UPI00115BAB41|nr:ParB/RepB/Spo0J family partition protein [Campylobacter sp. MIT 99-7217]TQR30329.1 chromosome partitioning protein ParB [Campylobacter sp. MIT 99-7217]